MNAKSNEIWEPLQKPLLLMGRSASLTGVEPVAKIAFFLAFYRDGGAERVMMAIAKMFLRQGTQVDIVVCRDSARLKEAIPQGAVLHVLDCSPALAAWPLARYAKQAKPSAIYSTLIWPNISNIIAKRSAHLPYRAIIREANCLPQHFAFRSWPNRLVARRLVRYYYPKADAVICVCEQARSHLESFLGTSGHRLHAIANPVDLDAITSVRQQPCQHPWVRHKGGPVIVAAGRLTPQKGFSVLLKAFARIDVNARLILLGDGPERAALQTIIDRLGINERVDMPGFANNPYAYLDAADVFVLSSYHEGSPNILLDALACGCQIVSTDCASGPRELLDGGRYGTLVPPGNIDRLADAMANALQQPRSDHPDRADYLKRFSLANIAQQYQQLAKQPDHA